MFSAVNKGEKEAVAFYNQWIEQVKNYVPKDRLLIHNAKDGWEPLCNFLEVPIPMTPYPRLGDLNAIEDEIASRKRIGYLIGYVLPGIAITCLATFLYI